MRAGGGNHECAGSRRFLARRMVRRVTGRMTTFRAGVARAARRQKAGRLMFYSSFHSPTPRGAHRCFNWKLRISVALRRGSRHRGGVRPAFASFAPASASVSFVAPTTTKTRRTTSRRRFRFRRRFRCRFDAVSFSFVCPSSPSIVSSSLTWLSPSHPSTRRRRRASRLLPAAPETPEASPSPLA